MEIDNIINEVLQRSIPGEGLFIVEGNPARNLLRILPADQAFKDNLNCFAWDINTGFQFMAIFTEEKLAADYIESVRDRIRLEDGTRLI